jgi:DNA invertase Pin-like site-specific DNA recombinase
MGKEQVATTAKLAALDAAIDAVENPRFIAINSWLAEFYRADKRKRGRMIRQKRKRQAELEKNKLHACASCGKITSS